jgi:hypothetical protein
MDEMIEALQDELEERGWALADETDPFVGLICPHGHAVELDGSCPEGCVSPIRDAGLI